MVGLVPPRPRGGLELAFEHVGLGQNLGLPRSLGHGGDDAVVRPLCQVQDLVRLVPAAWLRHTRVGIVHQLLHVRANVRARHKVLGHLLARAAFTRGGGGGGGLGGGPVGTGRCLRACAPCSCSGRHCSAAGARRVDNCAPALADDRLGNAVLARSRARAAPTAAASSARLGGRACVRWSAPQRLSDVRGTALRVVGMVRVCACVYTRARAPCTCMYACVRESAR